MVFSDAVNTNSASFNWPDVKSRWLLLAPTLPAERIMWTKLASDIGPCWWALVVFQTYLHDCRRMHRLILEDKRNGILVRRYFVAFKASVTRSLPRKISYLCWPQQCGTCRRIAVSLHCQHIGKPRLSTIFPIRMMEHFLLSPEWQARTESPSWGRYKGVEALPVSRAANFFVCAARSREEHWELRDTPKRFWKFSNEQARAVWLTREMPCV